MAQIFHPSTNTISRVSIFGAVFILGGLVWAASILTRSSYVTHVNVARAQPVPFSHKHHVGAIGLDCRYCHTSVEEGAFAGIPPTKTCMTCHSQLFDEEEILAPVRESWDTDRSIPWTRVHDLPDFAYFDHSIHLYKGIGCSTCHGEVDRMPLMWRENTLHMEWCLSCHREPERFVRPRDKVFDLRFNPHELSPEERGALAEEYGLQSMTSCSTCHR